MGIGAALTSSRTDERHPSLVKTVVIPVAGRGARLFPVTKGIRKELLPAGRKPLLLYAVEEAIASGAELVVFVTAANDESVQRFFSGDAELESLLEAQGREREAVALRTMCTSVRLSFVHQEFPRGLADAVLCARKAITDGPFAVILPDALILSGRPCIGQLMDGHARYGGTVIATRLIEPEETHFYGMLEIDSGSAADSGIVRVRSTVEKPRPECAPSLYGIFGRYILEPGIFKAIEMIKTDASKELQLTEAINLRCQESPVFGCLFEGKHFDTGSWLGYSKAALECMLTDCELGPALSQYLSSLSI